MTFDTRVNGIPCKCEVLDYQPYIPMRITGPGFGDADPPEDEYFEFQLLDRRGRPAPWLERYLSPDVEDELLAQYREVLRKEIYDGSYKEPS